MNYQELRKEREAKYNTLFRDCKVFWAFSKQQFQEGKEKIGVENDEELCTIMGGGCMPKANAKKLKDGMDAIDKWEKDLMQKHNLEEAHIKYELANHECWYTGNIEDAEAILPYPRERVLEVYRKYYQEMTAEL